MTDYPIHIVDDDDSITDMLGRLLNAAGYDVATYHSADELLQGIDDSSSGCLLLDMRLSGTSGLELQRDLNTRGIRLPVIFMSGYADVRSTVEAMKGGAIGVLEKPFTDAELLNFIESSKARNKQGGDEPAGREDTVSSRLARLTKRERQVFELLIAGNANKAIAGTLGISPRTVEFHRARVMEKMQTRSLAHLVRVGISAGIDCHGAV